MRGEIDLLDRGHVEDAVEAVVSGAGVGGQLVESRDIVFHEPPEKANEPISRRSQIDISNMPAS